MLLVGPNGGEDLRPWNEQLESFGASYISPLMEQIWNQNSTSELYRRQDSAISQTLSANVTFFERKVWF